MDNTYSLASPLRSRDLLDCVISILLVLLAASGFIKSFFFSWLPFDLALALLILLIIICTYRICTEATEISYAEWILPMYWFLFLGYAFFSYFFSNPKPGYPLEVFIKLFFLCTPLVLGGYFIVRTPIAFRLFLNLLLALPLLLLILHIYYYMTVAHDYYACINLFYRDYTSTFGIDYLGTAMYLGLGILICFSRIISEDYSRKDKIFYWFCFLAFISLSFLLRGRGPIVSWVLMLVFYLPTLFFVRGKRTKGIYIFAGMFLVAFLALLLIWFYVDPHYWPRTLIRFSSMLSDLNESTNSYLVRLRLFSTAWAIFLESPILGMGLGSFAELGGIYTGDVLLQYPHNLILETLCELGSVGFFLVFILILFPAARSALSFLITTDNSDALAASLSFFMLLVWSMMSATLHQSRYLFLFTGVVFFLSKVKNRNYIDQTSSPTMHR